MFLKRLTNLMEKQLYPKATVIVDIMPPCTGMFFIKQGSVSLVSVADKSRRPQHLFKGESFMKSAIFEEQEENSIVVRSSTDCELWFLSKRNFDKVVSEFSSTEQLKSAYNDIEYMRNTAFGRKVDSRTAPKPDLKKLLLMKEARERSSLVLLPNCIFIRMWTLLLLLSNTYTMISLPFFISFFGYIPISNFYTLEIVFDFIFVFDILLRAFFVAFVDRENVIDIRAKITANYIFSSSSKFKYHCLAALPLELIFIFGRCIQSSSLLCRYVYLLRLNKVFRLVNIGEQIQILEDIFCNFDSLFKDLRLYFTKFIYKLVDIDEYGCCFCFKSGDDQDDQECEKGIVDGVLRGSVYMQSTISLKVAQTGDLQSYRQNKLLDARRLEISNKICSSKISQKEMQHTYFGMFRNTKDDAAYASSKRATMSFRKNMFRMINLTFIIFVAAHVIGCIFFVIGSELSRGGQYANWINSANLAPCCSNSKNSSWDCPEASDMDLISNQYVAALYWATFTLTTVGYGDITAVSELERVFNIFVFIGGVAIYATVIAYIQEIISQLDVTTGTKLS